MEVLDPIVVVVIVIYIVLHKSWLNLIKIITLHQKNMLYRVVYCS